MESLKIHECLALGLLKDVPGMLVFAGVSDFSVTHFAMGSPLDRASRPIKPKLLMHVFTLMSSKDEFVMVFFVAFPHF